MCGEVMRYENLYIRAGITYQDTTNQAESTFFSLSDFVGAHRECSHWCVCACACEWRGSVYMPQLNMAFSSRSREKPGAKDPPA